MEKCLLVPQKLNIHIPCDTVILLLRLKMSTYVQQKTCTKMSKEALFVIAKTLKKCPFTIEWLINYDIVIAMEHYFAIKTTTTTIQLIRMTWMNLRDVMLGEGSQMQKNTYYMTSFKRSSKTSKTNLRWIRIEITSGRGYKETFWVVGNVLYLDLGGGVYINI